MNTSTLCSGVRIYILSQSPVPESGVCQKNVVSVCTFLCTKGTDLCEFRLAGAAENLCEYRLKSKFRAKKDRLIYGFLTFKCDPLQALSGHYFCYYE